MEGVHQEFTVDSLYKAAESGDIGFLKRAITSKLPAEYFFRHEYQRNFITKAMYYGREDFIRVALQSLPAIVSLQLLLTGAEFNKNTLHVAASPECSLQLVKFLVECYQSRLDEYLLGSDQKSDDVTTSDLRFPPWMRKTTDYGRTPFTNAIHFNQEDKAIHLLSFDTEKVCNTDDNAGLSPLCSAILQGLNVVAQGILNSGYNYSISGQNRSTALHVVPHSSENVCRLLLEKNPELIQAVDQDGFSVLHKWAEIGKVWPFQLLLERSFSHLRTIAFREVIYLKDHRNAYNPLHLALSKKNEEVARVLINGYQLEIGGHISNSSSGPPWRMKDNHGRTALHCALNFCDLEELSLYLLRIDSGLCHIRDHLGESPLFCAVKMGCNRVVKEIVESQDLGFSTLCRIDGQTVFHILSACTENIGTLLAKKFWWLINLKDTNGRTALDNAKDTGVLWLINMLSDPSLIQKEPFDWIKACQTGDLSALTAFIEHCPEFKILCTNQNDTPLHHIKLQTHEEYQQFLTIPVIGKLKNTLDADGATPLHRALGRKDIVLVEVLLTTDGVDRNIKDRNAKSAMNFLAELCNEDSEWVDMCKRIQINPFFKTAYIQPETNLADMRGTLSVVAALLATITFAAGFTLPGGFSSVSGDALLAKKAAFLIFLLADTYAMCTAMFVLFCLIWSMVCDPDKSLLLIDRSVVILMQSLYGTLSAFMMGVFTVTSHQSGWAAILILIMCIAVGIATRRSILYKILEQFIPAAKTDQRDLTRLLEQGQISTRTRSNPQMLRGPSSSYDFNQITSRFAQRAAVQTQDSVVQLQLTPDNELSNLM